MDFHGIFRIWNMNKAMIQRLESPSQSSIFHESNPVGEFPGTWWPSMYFSWLGTSIGWFFPNFCHIEKWRGKSPPKQSIQQRKNLGFFGVCQGCSPTKKDTRRPLVWNTRRWHLCGSKVRSCPEHLGVVGCWLCPHDRKIRPKRVLRTYEKGELTPLEVSWLSDVWQVCWFVEFKLCLFHYGKRTWRSALTNPLQPLPDVVHTYNRLSLHIYIGYYVYLSPWHHDIHRETQVLSEKTALDALKANEDVGVTGHQSHQSLDLSLRH